MTDEYAYSTDNPEAVAAFRQTGTDMSTFLTRLRADIAALPGVANPLVYRGVWGLRDELVALEPDGSGVVPDGWRLVRGRFEPRRGKPGDAARKWLADHQPPDVRHTLTQHGLPRHVSIATGAGGFRMVSPMLFEHDGVLWACFSAEPSKGFFGDEDPCTWTPRKLSEFHAAREAVEAAKSEAVAA
jgi:hypothetical protein